MNDKLKAASATLQEQFAKAAQQKAEQQKAQQAGAQQEQSGSKMINRQAPGMHNTPDSKDPAWKAIKQQDFNKDLTQEKADFDKYYKQLNDSANARKEAQKQLDLKNEQDKDNDDRSK